MHNEAYQQRQQSADMRIAPFAGNSSIQIDLLVPSYNHKCHMCSIVLAKYTRVVVMVNEPDLEGQSGKYRNYCVSCLAQHITQIAGTSKILDYYVCPKITRKQQKLKNWSTGQISELFECVARFGESSTKQIHKQFVRVTKEDRIQKELEMQYKGIYNGYFQDTPLDHINHQQIEAILPEEPVDDCAINVQDYPLEDQYSVESFLNLAKSDNYTQFYNGSSDKGYLCKDILMSQKIRKVGKTINLKQILDEDSEYLIQLLADELTKSQLYEKDFKVASKLLCDVFVFIQKRKNRSSRQSREEKSQQIQFNIQHPQLSKLSKIAGLANDFGEVIRLKQEREILMAQRQQQKSKDQNSRGESIAGDDQDYTLHNMIKCGNKKQNHQQSSGSGNEKESVRETRRSTQHRCRDKQSEQL